VRVSIFALFFAVKKKKVQLQEKQDNRKSRTTEEEGQPKKITAVTQRTERGFSIISKSSNLVSSSL